MNVETSINALFVLIGILYVIGIICYIGIKIDYKKIKNDIFTHYTYLNKYISNVKQYNDECTNTVLDQQSNVLDIVSDINDKYELIKELLIQRRKNETKRTRKR